MSGGSCQRNFCELSRWHQWHSLPSIAAATDGCKALSVATLSPSDRPCRELVVRLGSPICSGMGTEAPRNSFSWSKRLGANIPVTKLASSLSKPCRHAIFSQSAQTIQLISANRKLILLCQMSCDEQMQCCAGMGPDWTVSCEKPACCGSGCMTMHLAQARKFCTAVTNAEACWPDCNHTLHRVFRKFR